MYLSPEEQAMLAGEQGPGVQKAIEIVVALGRIYGAKDLESMTFLEQLKALETDLNLTFIPVLSAPDTNWEGERGYINAEIMKRHLPWQYKWFKYLICGPKPLMDAMEIALPDLGVPPHNVLTERFDMI